MFHVACRRLSSKEADTFVRISSQHLSDFVEGAKELYGSKFVSLNVHNLNHIADDVRNMQSNLDDISAFSFETELGRIKHSLL